MALECAPSQVTGRTSGGRPFLVAAMSRVGTAFHDAKRSGGPVSRRAGYIFIIQIGQRPQVRTEHAVAIPHPREGDQRASTSRSEGGSPVAGMFRIANDLRLTQPLGGRGRPPSQVTGRTLGGRAACLDVATGLTKRRRLHLNVIDEYIIVDERIDGS